MLLAFQKGYLGAALPASAGAENKNTKSPVFRRDNAFVRGVKGEKGGRKVKGEGQTAVVKG